MRAFCSPCNYQLGRECKRGNLDEVKLLIDRGADDWNLGFYHACREGHLDIVKFMIEKGANNWYLGIYYACEGGHLDIVKLMIEKGAEYSSRRWGMVEASKREHFDIVKYMIEQGETSYNNLDIYKFVKWIPEEELVPFYELPNLSDTFKSKLNHRVLEYKNKMIEFTRILDTKMDEKHIVGIITGYL